MKYESAKIAKAAVANSLGSKRPMYFPTNGETSTAVIPLGAVTIPWAGIVTAPSGITAVLVSPFVGKDIGRFDPRLFATAAFAIFALSYFMRAAYPPDASLW